MAIGKSNIGGGGKIKETKTYPFYSNELIPPNTLVCSVDKPHVIIPNYEYHGATIRLGLTKIIHYYKADGHNFLDIEEQVDGLNITQSHTQVGEGTSNFCNCIELHNNKFLCVSYDSGYNSFRIATLNPDTNQITLGSATKGNFSSDRILYIKEVSQGFVIVCDSSGRASFIRIDYSRNQVICPSTYDTYIEGFSNSHNDFLCYSNQNRTIYFSDADSIIYVGILKHGYNTRKIVQGKHLAVVNNSYCYINSSMNQIDDNNYILTWSNSNYDLMGGTVTISNDNIIKNKQFQLTTQKFLNDYSWRASEAVMFNNSVLVQGLASYINQITSNTEIMWYKVPVYYINKDNIKGVKFHPRIETGMNFHGDEKKYYIYHSIYNPYTNIGIGKTTVGYYSSGASYERGYNDGFLSARTLQEGNLKWNSVLQYERINYDNDYDSVSLDFPENIPFIKNNKNYSLNRSLILPIQINHTSEKNQSFHVIFIDTTMHRGLSYILTLEQVMSDYVQKYQLKTPTPYDVGHWEWASYHEYYTLDWDDISTLGDYTFPAGIVGVSKTQISPLKKGEVQCGYKYIITLENEETAT